MALSRRATLALGLGVFVAAAAVFLITLTPTVPFWDSGEFIAVSNILGIPHPPGTPFYVLLGRLATMVPIGTLAQRVNGLSALSSALAVLLTYLVALRLIRLAQSGRAAAGGIESRTAADEWIAQIGAVIAALMLAFSDNFWENAIEAEVYSMMSLAQILVFWLGLKWWEAHDQRPTSGPLLTCVYVMWLCVGLHLGVGMMGLPLVVMVAAVDRRAAVVFAMPFLSVLGVTWGLETMVGIVLVLSTITFVVYAWERKLNGWVVTGSAIGAVIGMVPAFGDANFSPVTAAIATASLAAPLIAMARRGLREARIIALALFLMVAGYSTHLYLPIRAAQHPAINEGNPATWENLRDLLERKQYGHTSMFVRRGTLANQLDKEFWRYWNRQWTLFPTPQARTPLAEHHEPRMWQSLLPLLLGVLGGYWQGKRERVSFLTTATLFAFATVGMIIFLNFSDHEVRDRDYFFTTGYHVFCLWIGMGAAYLITWVRESFGEQSGRQIATAAAAGLLLLQPLLLARSLWFTHDRRGNFVAHDYAYNMLAPLAKNSYVFTNGDNDTFPLWYMQQVENFRRDVRVVNLSLLNTDWYILQLRDEEPKVPMHLSDAEIKTLGGGAVADSLGHVVYTNQFMVGHIVESSRVPGDGWTKQPYFAVTVPEHMGLEPYFSLEGLVYRVNPDSLQGTVDEPTTHNAVYQTFKYRGLFNADGSWDTTVYKDENASTLSRNYAAAHLQLAFYYKHRNEIGRAIAEMERVSRMFPDYADVLIPLGGFYLDAHQNDKAIALFKRLVASSPGNPEVHYYYGVAQAYQHQLDGALHEFESAIQLDPNYNMPYYAAYYALYEAGQRGRALSYLQRWVDAHPNDPQAKQMLLSQGGALRSNGGTSELPPPPPPEVP